MFSLGGPYRSQYVGRWLSANDTMEIAQPNVFERRRDLSGVTLRNCVLQWAPVSYVFDKEGHDLVETNGLFMNLLDMLRAVMRFRVESQRPADGVWGTRLKNGTWNGIIGVLTR